MHTKLSRISRLRTPISICSATFLITPLPNFKIPLSPYKDIISIPGSFQLQLQSFRSYRRTKENTNPQVLEAPIWKRIQLQLWNPTSKSPNYSIADQITVQSTFIRRTHNLEHCCEANLYILQSAWCFRGVPGWPAPLLTRATSIKSTYFTYLGAVYTMDHEDVPRPCKIYDWLLNSSRNYFILHKGQNIKVMKCSIRKR